ncbi:tetratricopeptide repeat protein [Tenacibaculum larymnensis]|uniref:Tetratricopeptide repeat protein n=1 Tax=Tenacibaculum larymnensis TaxID=2878201 RepID=A0A9X4ELS5_9FLAO|nr:tetratricopeptide repeat protein [Tenacibaculum larymnensis]MDE1205394.1 tetratricopeptide repeat protein [Tenacibaculum larymnensis]
MKNKSETYKKQTALFFFLFLFISSFGQSKVDTLSDKTMEELFSYSEKSENKEDKIRYIKAFLKVAKREKHKQRIAGGYWVLSELYNDASSLIYLDSIVSLTKNNGNKYYPGYAYHSKANFYFVKGDFKKALDNYLKANNCAKKQGNTDLIMSTNYSIGTIKRNLKEYDEALKIYVENINYIKKKNKSLDGSYYLTTIMAISNVFSEKKDLDSATFYNELGVKKSLKNNFIDKYHHFSINQGIVNYHAKKYHIAIDSIKKHVSFLKENEKLSDYSYACFYLGKCYQKIGNKILAVKYFKEVDSIFQKNKNIPSDSRYAYEFLVDFYKEKKDLKKQLLYVNKLIYYDSINYNKYNYINKKILKEYDIPKLKEEKEIIIKKLEKKYSGSRKLIFTISVFCVVLLTLLYFQYKKRKTYKTRFEEILKTTKSTEAIERTKTTDIKLNIPKETVDKILYDLSALERENRFVVKNITLNSLAKELNTNTKLLIKNYQSF